MDELNLIIANNISTLRTLAGMTQSELAEKLNYTDKLVSKWERGEGTPNAYTLKQLSEIFHVTVDDLFTDHTVTAKKDPPKTVNVSVPKVRTKIITAIVICSIWLGAFLLFTVLWILNRPFFSIFVYTLPVSTVTYLVLNSIFNRGKHNFWVIAVLVAGVAVSVYAALLKFNCWQIFLLLIPAEFIVFLCAMLKRKPDSKSGAPRKTKGSEKTNARDARSLSAEPEMSREQTETENREIAEN